MKIIKSFLFIGFISALFVLLTAFIFNNITFALKTSGCIGGGLLLLAAVLSGALVSGDRMRANTYSESSSERVNRVNASGILIKLGVPHLILCIAIYYSY
jgi:hypothetical protein